LIVVIIVWGQWSFFVVLILFFFIFSVSFKATYIAMQKQHQQKHVEDVNSVLAHVTNICTEYSIDMKG